MFARVSIVSCILAVALATSATPQYKRWGPSKRPSSCPTPVTETTTETATVTVTAASSGPTSITIDQCNTGAIQCCNTVTQVSAMRSAIEMETHGRRLGEHDFRAEHGDPPGCCEQQAAHADGLGLLADLPEL